MCRQADSFFVVFLHRWYNRFIHWKPSKGEKQSQLDCVMVFMRGLRIAIDLPRPTISRKAERGIVNFTTGLSA